MTCNLLRITVLKFFKNILPGAKGPLLHTAAAAPRTMAELVEFLILLQAQGTAPNSGREGNVLRLANLLSTDPYCLGYMNGMFESLCHQWEVPVAEQQLVSGSACTLLFRDLLENCCDLRHASTIEDAAFNGARLHAGDPAFQRGKFDGCSELMRYTATKKRDDMPTMLHERFKQLLTEAA